MKTFIFHCWGGDGRGCWRGWLQDRLRDSGHEVLSPDFPGADNPKLEDWLAAARALVPEFKPGDGWILVGHSLGGPTILHLLESFGEKEKVSGVILVAAFAKDLGIPQIRGFVEKKFDWERIKKASDRFVVINSDNDPFIKLSEGERVAKMLGADFIVEHGAGHINEGAGFTEYPRVLEVIRRMSEK